MIKQTSTFPRVYQDVPGNQLLQAFDQGPDRITKVIFGLTYHDLVAHVQPGKWSVLEILFHVVDSELMGACRIRQTLAQPGTMLPGYDQDIWAEALAYQSRNNLRLQNALDLFRLLRKTSCEIFHSLGEVDWQKSAIHPEHGKVTLRNLLELYADHSERHIEQILAARDLLGKPLDLQVILPKRLY